MNGYQEQPHLLDPHLGKNKKTKDSFSISHVKNALFTLTCSLPVRMDDEHDAGVREKGRLPPFTAAPELQVLVHHL